MAEITVESASGIFITVAADGSGDYTTIEDGIAGAPAGATLQIKRGTYSPAATLTPKANQTLQGEGAGATIILAPVGSTAFNISVADVTVCDLEVNGQRLLQPNVLGNNYSGFSVTGARCTIRNVYLHDVRNIGVYANAADDLRVIDCRIENHATSATVLPASYSYKGIYCQGCARPGIQNCILRGWSQAIGLWYGVSHARVLDNFLRDNFGFEDDAHTVNRSAIEDYGATVVGHGWNLFAGNLVDGSTSHCFEIAQGVVGSIYRNNTTRRPGKLSNYGNHFDLTGATGQTTNDILIEGNNIASDGTRSDSAITVNGAAARISITKNSIRDFTNAASNAIFLGGTATSGDMVIEGNQIYNCRGGITLNNCGDGILIKGNLMRGMPFFGVANISLDSGSHHIIEGNSLDTLDAGIRLGPTVTRIRVVNNSVRAAAQAVVVFASDNLIAQNTLLSTTGGPTVNILGSRNSILDNEIQGVAGNRTLYVQGTGDYNVAQGNRLYLGFSQVQSGGTHNTIEPNHDATTSRTVTLKPLGGQTVGTTQTAIAHGLGYAPTVAQITMTSAGQVYKSAVSDATNVYLTADAAGRTAEIYVR